MHQYSVCINQFMMAIKSGIYVFKSITRQQRKISNLTRKSRITYILYSLTNQIKTIDVCCFFIVMFWRYTTSKDNPYPVTFSAYQSVMTLQIYRYLNRVHAKNCCSIGQYVKLSCIWLDSKSCDIGYLTWPTNGMLLDVSVSQ